MKYNRYEFHRLMKEGPSIAWNMFWVLHKLDFTPSAVTNVDAYTKRIVYKSGRK